MSSENVFGKRLWKTFLKMSSENISENVLGKRFRKHLQKTFQKTSLENVSENIFGNISENVSG